MGGIGLGLSGSGHGSVVRFLNTVMNLRVPYKAGDILTR